MQNFALKTFKLRFIQPAFFLSSSRSTFKMPKQNKESKKTTGSQAKPVVQNKDNLCTINLDKSGNICIKVHAKPGAKINSITGKFGFIHMYIYVTMEVVHIIYLCIIYYILYIIFMHVICTALAYLYRQPATT